MSFQAKSEQTLNQQLKVEKLMVTTLEPSLSFDSSGDRVIVVGEVVTRVYRASRVVAAGTATGVAAANISIVNSADGASGGDQKAIKLAGVTLAAGDSIEVCYATAK